MLARSVNESSATKMFFMFVISYQLLFSIGPNKNPSPLFIPNHKKSLSDQYKTNHYVAENAGTFYKKYTAISPIDLSDHSRLYRNCNKIRRNACQLINQEPGY